MINFAIDRTIYNISKGEENNTSERVRKGFISIRSLYFVWKKNISELHKQDVNTKIKTCDKASKKGIRERFLQSFLSVSNSFNISGLEWRPTNFCSQEFVFYWDSRAEIIILVNLFHIFKIPFHKNAFGGLLLYVSLNSNGDTIKRALHYLFNWAWFLEINKLCNVATKNLRFSTNRKFISLNWKV